ncbi:hypothetical protein L345_04002, partial [Ophiophagus hannah]
MTKGGERKGKEGRKEKMKEGKKGRKEGRMKERKLPKSPRAEHRLRKGEQLQKKSMANHFHVAARNTMQTVVDLGKPTGMELGEGGTPWAVGQIGKCMYVWKHPRRKHGETTHVLFPRKGPGLGYEVTSSSQNDLPSIHHVVCGPRDRQIHSWLLWISGVLQLLVQAAGLPSEASLCVLGRVQPVPFLVPSQIHTANRLDLGWVVFVFPSRNPMHGCIFGLGGDVHISSVLP